ncbi:MAG: hypothetical protein KAT29_04215, partial [Anaerolineales bacterium]|nr:hypothetical protein [Anaerolineales bacterium]
MRKIKHHRHTSNICSTEAIGLLVLCIISFILVTACSNVQPTPDPAQPFVYRLQVSEPGVYRITEEMLNEAGASRKQDDPQAFKLFQRGIEQPIWVTGDGDDYELHFWGSASDSVHAPDNIYLLTTAGENGWWAAEPGAIDENVSERNYAGEEDPELQLPNNTYAHRITLDDNLLYLPQVESGEHWYWEMLPAPSSKEYSFRIDHLPDVLTPEQDAIVRIAIYGSTEAGDKDPDHHLEIRVNGQVVADEWWDGIGGRIIEAGFPADILRNGENTLTITAPGDTGVAADIYHIDWINIFHPRKYVAIDDQLTFT